MSFAQDHFTMSYHQARNFGIDYRNFKKMDCLPEGVPLVAVAGVWGDYQNISCLFVEEEENGYMRNIRRWGDKGYLIKELGVDAKEISVGQLFRLAETEWLQLSPPGPICKSMTRMKHVSNLPQDIEAVCFDAFGTVVEITERNKVGRRLLSFVTPHHRREFKMRLMCEDRSLAEWFSLFEIRVPSQVVSDLERDVMIEANSVHMRPGMLDAWSELRQMGLQIGLCSNLAASYGAGVLAALPDSPDVMVFSYLSGVAKPNPEIYALATRRFRLVAKRILFVGDTPRADIEGPKCAGMIGMHINEFERLRV